MEKVVFRLEDLFTGTETRAMLMNAATGQRIEGDGPYSDYVLFAWLVIAIDSLNKEPDISALHMQLAAASLLRRILDRLPQIEGAKTVAGALDTQGVADFLGITRKALVSELAHLKVEPVFETDTEAPIH
jgi:hypothetical protein